jgi:hypothetical protein
VAMCALHVLGDLVEALKRGDVVGGALEQRGWTWG